MTNKFLKSIFLTIALIVVSFSSVRAADPQVLITWKTKTYIPPAYSGKALPVSNSPVLASLEIIQSGKIADLSGRMVYWYLDDKLIGKGFGAQTITFRAPESLGGDALRLRAQVPDYPGGLAVKTILVPVVSPSVAVDAPYPKSAVSSRSVQLRALPYFFGVTDLSFLTFTWTLNGSPVQSAENPQYLIVNLNADAAAGSSLGVGASITNPAGYFESAKSQKNLIYSP